MYPAEIILVTMTISSSVSSGSTIYQTPITLNFTSTVSTSDFTLSDIVVKKDGITLSTSDYLSNFQGSGSSYSADFSNTTDGLYTFFIPELTYSNSDGTKNSDSNTFSLQSCVTNKVQELLNQADLPSLVETISIYIGSNPISVTGDAMFNNSLGKESLQNITTGKRNFSLGYGALSKLTGGNNNVSIGDGSQYNSISGSSNIGIGSRALNSNQTSSANIAIGERSLFSLENGYSNISIGLRSSENQNNIINTATIGNGDIEKIYMNDSGSGVIYANGTINTSDKNLKKNIAISDLGLNFINQLKPVTYEWKNKENSKKSFGLIAQEVEEIMNNLNMSKNEYSLVNYDESNNQYGINYSELIGPLIKSVQELSNENKVLKEKILKIENKFNKDINS